LLEATRLEDESNLPATEHRAPLVAKEREVLRWLTFASPALRLVGIGPNYLGF
jgi:hypothetical protein